MTMFEMRGEAAATLKCIELAKTHGYGNLMSRMLVAWALQLIENYEMPISTACGGATMDKDETKRWCKCGVEAMREYVFEGVEE